MLLGLAVLASLAVSFLLCWGVFFFLLALFYQVAMYLPGVTKNEYTRVSEASSFAKVLFFLTIFFSFQPQEVELKVIKLDSTQTLLPYRYYELPFCRPEKIEMVVDNLGEILSGDRIQNSVFRINALEDVKCRLQCVKTLDEKDMEKFRTFIAEDYRAHIMVDGLPAAYYKQSFIEERDGKQTLLYQEGYPIGGDFFFFFLSYFKAFHQKRKLFDVLQSLRFKRSERFFLLLLVFLFLIFFFFFFFSCRVCWT